jgi:hypothetical protein
MFKRIAAATIMLCAVGGASATTWDIGLVPTTDEGFGTTRTVFGTFSDEATFSIPTGTLGLSANVLEVVGAKSGYTFNIVGLTYSIWKDGGKISTDFSGGLTPNYASLTAGDYELHISGTATGAFGGLYGVNLTVTPVPEPATYGMMVVGLGLLGLAKRRRDASNDKFM